MISRHVRVQRRLRTTRWRLPKARGYPSVWESRGVWRIYDFGASVVRMSLTIRQPLKPNHRDARCVRLFINADAIVKPREPILGLLTRLSKRLSPTSPSSTTSRPAIQELLMFFLPFGEASVGRSVCARSSNALRASSSGFPVSMPPRHRSLPGLMRNRTVYHS